jgi:UDP-2,4-diacetamido-2,4,6-trideoxy-beta-L-altropyranose hydrolase
MPQLIIRADANSVIGTGHIMRCIALAQSWRDHGGKVKFITYCSNSFLINRIVDEGFSLYQLEKSYPDSSEEYSFDEYTPDSRCKKNKNNWIVLDGYHFDSEYQTAAEKTGYKVMIIDDMAHLSIYHADILINQNISAKKQIYNVDSNTKLLLGSRYVMLRKEFLQFKKQNSAKIGEVKNILVTLGGADTENVTLIVLKALIRLVQSDLKIKIVVGPLNPNLQTIKNKIRKSNKDIEVLTSVKEMPSLISWADVAVSGGGSTCWELAFYGLPFLVVVLAKNQMDIAAGLSAAGAAINLGWHRELKEDYILKRIKNLIEDLDMRYFLSQNSRNLIDGQGAERIIKEMVKLK